MSSEKSYKPEFLPGFKEDIDSHPDHKDRAMDKVRLVCEAPYAYSHPLTKKKDIDLTGYRAVHVGKKKFVMIIEIDDTEMKILFHLYGPHDEAYGAKT